MEKMEKWLSAKFLTESHNLFTAVLDYCKVWRSGMLSVLNLYSCSDMYCTD